LIDEPVTVAEGDPRWPAQAADEIARLRGALGELPIEHVGSTAVAQLAATPVIDLEVYARAARSRRTLP